MNSGGWMIQIASLWTLKCCCLWPQWTVVIEGHEFPLCELSNIAVFGHNELWLLNDTNSPFVNSQMLLSLATMNNGGRMTNSLSVNIQIFLSLATMNCGSFDNEGSLCDLLNVEPLAIMLSKYIDCCIKTVFEWTTSPALANTTTMGGTPVFHPAQCVTITTRASIGCSTENVRKPASYKSQGVAQLEILGFEWNHNLKYDNTSGPS